MYYSIVVYSKRTDLQNVFVDEQAGDFENSLFVLNENFQHLDNVSVDVYFNMSGFANLLPDGLSVSDLPYSFILEFDSKEDYERSFDSPESSTYIYRKKGVPTLSEVNNALNGKTGILPFGLGLFDMPDWAVSLFSQFWKYIRLIIIYLILLFLVSTIYIKWRLR